MKKIKLIIFILLTLIISKIDVYALSNQFKASEKIPDVYYAKERNGIVVMSRQALFIRNSNTAEHVYCIEPFGVLIDNYNYKNYTSEYNSNLNISKEQWQRIRLLAYYGYKYNGHTDQKWYSITQVMIWRTADPSNKFYWVSSTGSKIDKFTAEIQEMEDLIKNHYTLPEIKDNYIVSINSEYTIMDTNDVLSNYEISYSDVEAKIVDNKLMIRTTTNGNKKIELTKRSDIIEEIPVFFYDESSQNIMSPGSLEEIKKEIKINVVSGQVSVTKVDSETLTTNPQGEASLIGAVYNLYNDKNELIKEMIIGTDNKANTSNLPYGNYYLKEVQSGPGYYIDKNKYEFVINEKNLNIQIIVKNIVIKNKIVIKKYYGDNDKFELEEGISFEIYDCKDNLIDILVTNKEGEIILDLPYGRYTLKQLTTTENYEMVEDIKLVIDELSDVERLIELMDYKINTPPASLNAYNYNLISYLFPLLFLFKKREYA